MAPWPNQPCPYPDCRQPIRDLLMDMVPALPSFLPPLYRSSSIRFTGRHEQLATLRQISLPSALARSMLTASNHYLNSEPNATNDHALFTTGSLRCAAQ